MTGNNISFKANSKIIILLLAGCVFPIAKVNTDVVYEKGEIAIYQALLYQGRQHSENQILIHEESTGNTLKNIDPAEVEKLMQEIGVPVEILYDWENKNKNRLPMTQSLDLQIDFEILSKSDFNAIFQATNPERAWKEFAGQFKKADGFIRLSKPGFDAKKNNSLVLIEYHCGAHCGTGRFINLQKNDSGRWKTVNSLVLWMAY